MKRYNFTVFFEDGKSLLQNASSPLTAAILSSAKRIELGENFTVTQIALDESKWTPQMRIINKWVFDRHKELL